MSTEIEEGHGRTDLSCRHGSRWVWWLGLDDKGKWEKVVWAPNCDCGDPPRPDKKEAKKLTAKELIQAACLHDWVPTFQGGDTYRCKKCGKEIDMTEDDEP